MPISKDYQFEFASIKVAFSTPDFEIECNIYWIHKNFISTLKFQKGHLISSILFYLPYVSRIIEMSAIESANLVSIPPLISSASQYFQLLPHKNFSLNLFGPFQVPL